VFTGKKSALLQVNVFKASTLYPIPNGPEILAKPDVPEN
jgi:hypothetical protein